jgi:hypothetical protein
MQHWIEKMRDNHHSPDPALGFFAQSFQPEPRRFSRQLFSRRLADWSLLNG